MLLFLKYTFDKAWRWGGRIRFFRKAINLWNCWAWHVVVDNASRTMNWTLAIPGLVTWFVQTPTLPQWLGARRVAGGDQERSEYGFWHDYHETKLQWRKVINRSDAGSGWEWRVVHTHPFPRVVRHETLLSAGVGEKGDAWAKAHGFDRWRLLVTTWRAQSSRWWIPSLYDHYFTLSGTGVDGTPTEITARFSLMPNETVETIFDQLAARFP